MDRNERIEQQETQVETLTSEEMGEGCGFYYPGWIAELNEEATACKEALFEHRFFGSCEVGEPASW